MPFDPNKSFEVIGGSKAAGFNPSKPFEVISDSHAQEDQYGTITAAEPETLLEKLGRAVSRVDPTTGTSINVPKDLWEQVNAPSVNLPAAPDLSGMDRAIAPGAGILGLVSPSQLAAGYNAAVKPGVEALTSPLGIASIGLGGAPKIAQVGASGLFAGLMGKGTLDQIKAAQEVRDNPNATEQQKLEATIAPVASGLMTLGAVGGGVHAARSPKLTNVKVKTGNGASIEVEGGLTVDQMKDLIKSDPAKEIPISEASKAKLIALGHDPATLVDVSETAAQDVLAQVQKLRQLAENEQLKKQKAAQAEAEKAAKEAQQPPQQDEAAKQQVQQQLDQVKKQAQAAQGQAVTELLGGATTKADATTSLAEANRIAVKPPGVEVPNGAINLIDNGVKPDSKVGVGPSYDDIVKGKKTHYQKTLEQLGVTEAQMQAAKSKVETIPMPLGEGAKLKIGPSAIEGQGVFVTQEIPKGEKLAPASIDGKWTPAGRYANHSGRPNAKFVVNEDGVVDLVATRKLNPNEELTINYKQAHDVVQESKNAIAKKASESNFNPLEDFDAAWEKSGKQAGSENQIAIKNGKVYKRNYNEKLGEVLPNHGSIEDFQKNLALHNEVFPETKLTFEGISKTKDGEAPVVSQVEVNGTTPTKAEVDAFMAKKGFKPFSRTSYINEETGVRAGDLKGDNVVKDASGEIHVIDPVLKRIDPNSAEIVTKKSPSEFVKWAQKLDPDTGGLTDQGITEGIKIIGDSKKIAQYKRTLSRLKTKLDKTLAVASKAEDPTQAYEDASGLGFQMQYIGDLLMAAEGSSASNTALSKNPRVVEAHEAFKVAAKQATPESVKIGPEPTPFVLPETLSKSNPRYAYGSKQFGLQFESELDKALYILAQNTPSKADAQFLKSVLDHTGITEQEARAAGRTVKDTIKMMAAEGKNGDILKIPNLHEDGFAPSQPVAAAVSQHVPLKELVVDPKLEKEAFDKEVEDIVNPPEPPTPPGPPSQPPPVPPAGGPPPVPSNHHYIQGLTKYGLGIGKLAEFAKVAVGTIEGNIRAVSPAIFGWLRKYEYAKSALSLDFEKATLPLSRLARKIFTDNGLNQFGTLLLNGKLEEAKAFARNHTRFGDQIAFQIDQTRAALEKAHELLSDARGEDNVPYLDNYFPRKVVDYQAFRKFFDKSEQGVIDAVIDKATREKGSGLTPEEMSAVLDSFIAGSMKNKGKPGFLKPRSVDVIEKNFAHLYEPFDVSLENYFRKVTNDVVNHSFFGKAADASGNAVYNPTAGTFGKAIADELRAGNLSVKAQKIVESNLRDRFQNEVYQDGITSAFGRRLRLATSAAYLGQLTTAIGQFGDIFSSTLHYGPIDTIKGYASRIKYTKGYSNRVTLSDINVHEGHVETAMFSRNKSAIGKAANAVLKLGVGFADQFNKGGQASAIVHHFADIVKDPQSPQFKVLDRKYSQQFPHEWPKILKGLKSEAFRQGKLTPDTQFFVYNELADIQPLNPSSMAQGYNASRPLAKAAWALKSYMIKQLDIMRTLGYEKLKSKDRHIKVEGAAFLAAYAAIVAAGQNFAVSWVRDKLLDRSTDTSDYFVSGFLQPLGISRYAIFQIKKDDWSSVAAETLMPAISLLKEGSKDASLIRDMFASRRDKSGRKTVRDLQDFFEQSELVKHVPLLGAQYYARFGKGAAKEKKYQEQANRGNPAPTLPNVLHYMVFPPDKKTDRN